MSFLKIARMGHPILLKGAEQVSSEELKSPDFQRLTQDMIHTLRERGAAILSAPQIHVSKRILVVEVSQNPNHPDFPEMPLSVLVNPEIQLLGPEQIHRYEGCLSMPGLRGRVVRQKRIRVEAVERTGEPVAFEVEGHLAALLQHGLDHLDGRLMVERMEDLASLSYRREWERHHYKGPWD